MTKRFVLLPVLAFVFMLLAGPSFAQTSEIRGFLYNEKNGEPLIFTTVSLKGTTTGVQTDVNGFYSITKLQPGNYTLFATALGFDSVSVPVTLKPNEIKTQKLYLRPSQIQLKSVNIDASRAEKTTTVNVAVEKISPKEIQIMPSIGGEADIAQYLQTVPGVIFTGDQGGQLYIRGGTPIQNLVLLDGMIIYNPFHSIGLFSVFDTDIVRNIEVYTGGFNAEYGGRTSAVMDVTTRDGNRNRFGGKFTANPFTSKLLLEGPIAKKEGQEVAGSSFLLSGRTSYLEQSSKIFYEYANEDGLPYNFTDLYGKVSLTSDNGNKFNVFGFNFNDRVNLSKGSAVKWDSYGGGADFLILPSTSSAMIHGLFAYSNYDIGITETTSRPRNSSINGFNIGLDFTYFIKSDELKYGISVIGNKTDFQGFTPTGVQQGETTNNTEMAGFFKYNMVRNRFVLQPSVRLHYYASLGNISPEPRLGFKFNITDNLRFKFAGGLFTQNFIATRSDQDVVNLFAGFLSSPDILFDAQGKRVENRLQKARHAMFGLEIDVTNNLEINIEPYLKHFNQLTNVNRKRLFESDAPYIIESGLAKGIDFSVNYNINAFMVQASYSLASVDRKFGDQVYRPNFDRRHNANILGNYRFGNNESYEVSVRWNLGSGFPFTPTQGFYERNLTKDIDADYTTENGEIGILYGELNSERLPYYHRLDLSASKTFRFSETSSLEINAGVINAYNRDNIFYIDRISSERVNQLPIIPSIGLSWNF